MDRDEPSASRQTFETDYRRDECPELSSLQDRKQSRRSGQGRGETRSSWEQSSASR